MIAKRLMILALGCLALSSSCGYSTHSLMPQGVNRVAVDVFANDTYYREIGIQLTREISTEINHRAALQVTRHRNADAILSGRIIEVRRPTLVDARNNLVSEQAVIVTANVELKNAKTGQVITNFTLANRAEFVVERGESLESAFDEGLRDLAEDIINQLERESFHAELEKIRSSAP